MRVLRCGSTAVYVIGKVFKLLKGIYSLEYAPR
jgi:hypothetical protein